MFCRNCGALNDDNEEFCKSCNTKLENEKENEKEKEKEKVEEVKPEVEIVNEVKTEQNNNTSDIPTFNSGHAIFLIIFSVLCCGGLISAVFAILALIEGNKINDYVAAGNLEMARKAKKDSDKWIKATYISWAIIGVLIILYFVFVFGITFMSAFMTGI